MFLTVTAGGVLRPVDDAVVVDGQEPLRAAEQLSYPYVTPLHVVVVPGVALVLGAVHDGSQLLGTAVTVDHTHAAEQENRMEVQSRKQILKVPYQHPFAHYHSMQWASVSNILKKCAIPQSSHFLTPSPQK